MKISSMCHKLLIYDVKWTTKIDGMGPFNQQINEDLSVKYSLFVVVVKELKWHSHPMPRCFFGITDILLEILS